MTDTADYFAHLSRVIMERKGADTESSYVARLFQKGRGKIAQKVGEEAVEVVIAAMEGSREGLVSESADLLFHWLILLAEMGIDPNEVLEEMHRREGISGLMEKASRHKP